MLLINVGKIEIFLSDVKEVYQEVYENVIQIGILGVDGGYDDGQYYDGNKQENVFIFFKKFFEVYKVVIKIGQEVFEKFVKVVGFLWVGLGDVYYDFYFYINL